MSKQSDEYATPQYIYDHITGIFGKCALDVCATRDNSKCGISHYNKYENGLDRTWRQTNWCNPPYSDSMPWVQKALYEANNSGSKTIMLLMADTSTKLFNFCLIQADLIAFCDKRIRFDGAKGSPKFGSMVVIFRPKIWNSPAKVASLSLPKRPKD